MRMTLIGILFAMGLGTAQAADMPRKAPVSAQEQTWSCGGWIRPTKGLLYDTPGFFGTKEWSVATLVGCSQVGGGWDFDTIGFVPLRGNGVANEFDVDVGYTWVHSRQSLAQGKSTPKWWTRVGVGYWNFEPSLGVRFENFDARVQTNYLLGTWNGFSAVVWLRADNQVLRAPIPLVHDHDFNVGVGANLSYELGFAKLLAEGTYFRHVKSFGPARDVFALTAEMPFDLGRHAGFALSAGPWWRGTLGNILGLPGNHEFNNTFGLKASAFN